MMMMMN